MAVTTSNANTSGLEVAGYANPEFMRRLRNYRERRKGTIHADETFLKATCSESYPEPLVTAASAQAMIAEEQAKAFAEQQAAIEENRLRLEAEARADRLAKALENLEAERKRDGVNLAHLKRAVAVAYADMNRAALQQEG